MEMKELPSSAGKSLTEKRKVAYNKEAVQRGTQTVEFLCCFLAKREGFKMNELVELLDELQKKAKADPILREKLLQTRENPNPIHAFCEICHAYGVSIYEMDLAMAGEEFCAEIKRSTNGGRENSPVLEGEDDFYELFLAALENI